MNIVQYIDLTSLNDDKSDDIQALIDKVKNQKELPSAICTWLEHGNALYSNLSKNKMLSDINMAAVLNFPSGQDTAIDLHNNLVYLTENIFFDEIDYVFDWQSWKSGDFETPMNKLREVNKYLTLRSEIKVILESGAFHDDLSLLREMCKCILDENGIASFLKTSTGKYSVGATPETARVIMEEVYNHNHRNDTNIVVPCGVKISGGVKTKEDAEFYISMAKDIFGYDWMTPENFRIGASSLYDNLIGNKEETEYSY
jgi:deoxyribose-phosphate aldolase